MQVQVCVRVCVCVCVCVPVALQGSLEEERKNLFDRKSSAGASVTHVSKRDHYFSMKEEDLRTEVSWIELSRRIEMH